VLQIKGLRKENAQEALNKWRAMVQVDADGSEVVLLMLGGKSEEMDYIESNGLTYFQAMSTYLPCLKATLKRSRDEIRDDQGTRANACW
jgi:hypothetical protein